VLPPTVPPPTAPPKNSATSLALPLTMPTLRNSGSTGASKKGVFVSKVKKRKASNIAQEKAAREGAKDEYYQPEEGEDSNNDDNMNGDRSVPIETVAVEGSASDVAHSDNDCAETSLSVAGSVDNNDACLSTAASMPPLKRIFDCEKLIRGVNTNGPYWECKHCNNIYAGINATKALCHVLKIKGTQNVAACKEDIPVMYLHCYEDLYSRQHRGKEAKAEEIVARSNMTAARQDKNCCIFKATVQEFTQSPPPSNN